MWVVAYGNVFDGVRLVGPFASAKDAEWYADANNPADDWYIVQLKEPEE